MVVSHDGEVGIARLVLTIDNNGAKKLSSHVNIILSCRPILISIFFRRCWLYNNGKVPGWEKKAANYTEPANPWVTIRKLNARNKPLRFT